MASANSLNDFRQLIPSHLVSDDEWLFIENIKAPLELKTLFLRTLYRDYKHDPRQESLIKKLVELSETSGIPSTDWIKAFSHVVDWCEDRDFQFKASDILGYIYCVSLSNEIKVGNDSLEKLTIDFLDQFGFERSR